MLNGLCSPKSSEMLPVVDLSGLVVGQASRNVCHGEDVLMHPVVHLHILNRSGWLFLRRRGAEKELLPMRWDISAGGHVSYGEYMDEALYRKADEELGFRDFNPCHVATYVFESGTERELVNVYAAVGKFELHPDNYEVSYGRYWSMKEIEASLGTGVFTPNFEKEFGMFKDKLLSLL